MTTAQRLAIRRPGGRDLAVDVFAPGGGLGGGGMGACVVLLHGGAWMFGGPQDMAAQAAALAAEGFTCIAAEYRLSPEATWPAQVQDVQDVIAWVRAQAADLRISPDRIALLGASAGGHLALMAAPQAAAVVAICAPPELRLPPAEAGANPIAALLGPGADAAAAWAASPLAHVSAAFPPVCLVGGGRDTLVPPEALLALYAALHAAGVPVDLHIHHGHAHGFDLLPSMFTPVLAQITLFLKRAMVDPGHYAQESERLNPFARPGTPAMPHPAPETMGAAS
jgi:acetyl esterase/lipase